MQCDFCFLACAVGRQVSKLCNGFAGLDEQVISLELMSPLVGSDILHRQACFFRSQAAGQKLLDMAPEAIDGACVHLDFSVVDPSCDGKNPVTVITGCMCEMKLLTKSTVDSGSISDEDGFLVLLRASRHTFHCSNLPFENFNDMNTLYYFSLCY